MQHHLANRLNHISTYAFKLHYYWAQHNIIASIEKNIEGLYTNQWSTSAAKAYIVLVQFPRIWEIAFANKKFSMRFLLACSKYTRDQSTEELGTLLYSRYLASLLYWW